MYKYFVYKYKYVLYITSMKTQTGAEEYMNYSLLIN